MPSGWWGIRSSVSNFSHLLFHLTCSFLPSQSYGSVIGAYLVNMLPSHRIGKVLIDGIVSAPSWANKPLYLQSYNWMENTNATYHWFLNSCSKVSSVSLSLSLWLLLMWESLTRFFFSLPDRHWIRLGQIAALWLDRKKKIRVKSLKDSTDFWMISTTLLLPFLLVLDQEFYQVLPLDLICMPCLSIHSNGLTLPNNFQMLSRVTLAVSTMLESCLMVMMQSPKSSQTTTWAKLQWAALTVLLLKSPFRTEIIGRNRLLKTWRTSFWGQSKAEADNLERGEFGLGLRRDRILLSWATHWKLTIWISLSLDWLSSVTASISIQEPDGNCEFHFGNILGPPERFTGPFNASLSTPMLLISNTADPITPLTSGQELNRVSRFLRSQTSGLPQKIWLCLRPFHLHRLQLMGSSSRLLIQKSPGHTSRTSDSNCTTMHYRRYFLEGYLPQDNTECEVVDNFFSWMEGRSYLQVPTYAFFFS